MCGIAGVVVPASSRRDVSESLVARMRDVLRHRGPDEFGLYRDAHAGLGHRRLSIVDVAAGQQPMSNEDGTLVMVYNGEVYNHADHRAELEARGHRYRTHCDTETILHLYEEHGPGVVGKLRGMFAFAIWNRDARELFLARDRLGVKPLYYVHDPDGSLYFASEIKSLLTAGAVRPSLNLPAVPDYLANHATSGSETLYAGVKRLPPGYTLLWRDGRITLSQYWDVPIDGEQVEPNPDERSDREAIHAWHELFRVSVRLRLMADVPLGMFLSGGIDSSAIAAEMARLVREPIKTFSVAFAEREANELEYARVVARAFRTDHHEVVVTPEQFFSALPRLVWHEDEPLAHPSSVALYFVSQLAARHVKVVLTGEGSDELLAGYARYKKTVLNLAMGRHYDRWMPAAARAAIRRASGALPGAIRSKVRRTFLCLPAEIEALYFDNFAVFSGIHQRGLLTPSAREAIGALAPYAEMRRRFDAPRNATLLHRLLYADLKTYLHELLMKQDQMSMAASIESRVPFLDHHLVEASVHLPERLKLRGWTTKYVLRESMRGVLPEEILNRPKMGFPVPVGRWFRTSHRHVLDEYVLGARAAGRGLFDPGYVRRMVEEHQAGAVDHWERLWALVNFELWQRQALDGDVDLPQLPDVPESPIPSIAA